MRLNIQAWSNIVKELVPIMHISICFHIICKEVPFLDITVPFLKFALQEKGIGQIFTILWCMRDGAFELGLVHEKGHIALCITAYIDFFFASLVPMFVEAALKVFQLCIVVVQHNDENVKVSAVCIEVASHIQCSKRLGNISTLTVRKFEHIFNRAFAKRISTVNSALKFGRMIL